MKYKVGYKGDTSLMKEGPLASARVCTSDSNGLEYDDDELEFMKAMNRYKRQHHRPYPCYHEVLHVLKSLGYRKQSTNGTD